MIHQILGSRMHVVKLWILPKCDQFCWKLTVSVHWHTVLFCKRLSDIRIFVYIYGRKTKKTHICIQKYIFIYTPLHPQWGEGHHGIPCYYAKDYHMYAYSFIYVGARHKNTHICIPAYTYKHTRLGTHSGEKDTIGIPCYYAKDYRMYAYSFIYMGARHKKTHTCAYTHLHINIHVYTPTVGRRASHPAAASERQQAHLDNRNDY